ncbi:hypothetical protein [Fibrobacter sp. UWEL]|uniref:hypothetical protein n=1 Tax=Fibrobacter sp. UWEL TaxID=1896209 RepID=UPI00093416FA|nr:hypothetical protein [Fibrobacter sp. UWEL]
MNSKSILGGPMIIDPIAISEQALENMEKTKEAAFERLVGAGILDKDGNLAKIYRNPPKKK